MENTFFTQVENLNITGDLNITIKQGAGNIFIVSVFLNNDKCGDEAKRLIPPLMLNGTAEELDNGFFESIGLPLRTTSGLLVNMEDYKKQQELAKNRSAMEKDKQIRAGKEKNTFEDLMKKVDELEAEGKYKDAWMKVPDPAKYPEHAIVIRERKSGLTRLFAPDLFNVEPKQTEPC